MPYDIQSVSAQKHNQSLWHDKHFLLRHYIVIGRAVHLGNTEGYPSCWYSSSRFNIGCCGSSLTSSYLKHHFDVDSRIERNSLFLLVLRSYKHSTLCYDQLLWGDIFYESLGTHLLSACVPRCFNKDNPVPRVSVRYLLVSDYCDDLYSSPSMDEHYSSATEHRNRCLRWNGNWFLHWKLH